MRANRVIIKAKVLVEAIIKEGTSAIYRDEREARWDLKRCSDDYLIKKYKIYSQENTYPDGVAILKIIKQLMEQRKLLKNGKVTYPYIPPPKKEK